MFNKYCNSSYTYRIFEKLLNEIVVHKDLTLNLFSLVSPLLHLCICIISEIEIMRLRNL